MRSYFREPEEYAKDVAQLLSHHKTVSEVRHILFEALRGERRLSPKACINIVGLLNALNRIEDAQE